MHDQSCDDVDDDAHNRHGKHVHGDRERRVMLDLLHIERDPECCNREGEKAEQKNSDDQREVTVAPDGHGDEGVGIPALAEDEGSHEEDTQDEADKDVRGLPPLGSVRAKTVRERVLARALFGLDRWLTSGRQRTSRFQRWSR